METCAPLEADEAPEEPLEITLLQKPEVLVHKIPPRQTGGHRAEAWQECIWRGRLLVVSKGNCLYIRLSDPTSGQLFAQCPVTEDTSDAVIERAIDSSRYFVIRLQDSSGHHAFVGMGFEDRNDAFDFNVTVQDFFRRLKVELEEARRPPQSSAVPEKDFSLKEGEKIHVSVKAFGNKSRRRKRESEKEKTQTAADVSGGIAPLLPPPPSDSADAKDSRQRRRSLQQPSPQPTSQPASPDLDLLDFDDFKTA